MRLFIAVNPPEDVLDEVEAAVAAALGVQEDPGLRWSRRDDRHITLLFLGETDPARLPGPDGLEKAFAAELARHRPERISLRGAGTFPGDDGAATVLWAGVQGERGSPLARPAAGLRRAARAHGVRVERRPFVPHLTLARSRRPTDLAGLRTALTTALATTFWEAGEAHLVESLRRDGEYRYRTAATWALG
ncbi:RNA 2',3'-cyclic phosphodiesterase [Nocardiopsis suaedae]|uniref:RNA 2',3'-cyclic phosphodiesterase n=1 Tax=Nocardiopsis suaedae TaxID=3018444 RepID=A0ABT4TMD3_9ACTN|nr:RNA 2',3'-cyclic phosphodiesterase [Nocardiopsis suaedae]MDA2805862.1 RNA 2',3'-cyclic phosphodiesterase [Nocardiopsis suaedae]